MRWLVLAIPALAGGSAAAPHHDRRIQQRIVQTDDGRPYRLSISTPDAPTPPAGFPLIVVLDGETYFASAARSAAAFARSGESVPVIVVGISAVSADSAETDRARMLDYTSAAPAELLPERVRREAIPTGGVLPFVTYLTDTLLPQVARSLPIHSRCRILFGHSLAGLAVLESLAARPTSFSTFVASSPSVWWGRGAVLTRLRQLPARGESDRPHVAITVGALEQPTARTPAAGSEMKPDFRMIDNALAAFTVLKQKPQATRPEFRILAGDDHAEAAGDALIAAVRRAGECGRPTAAGIP